MKKWFAVCICFLFVILLSGCEEETINVTGVWSGTATLHEAGFAYPTETFVWFLNLQQTGNTITGIGGTEGQVTYAGSISGNAITVVGEGPYINGGQGWANITVSATISDNVMRGNVSIAIRGTVYGNVTYNGTIKLTKT